MLPSSNFSSKTFADTKSNFCLSRCAKAVMAREATRAVGMILDCCGETTKGTYRRNSKGGTKSNLGGRENRFKLIQGWMKCRAIKNLIQWKLLSGSNFTLIQQCLKIFETNSKFQAACNYIFVSMTSQQDIAGKIRDPCFPYFVNIHEGRVSSGGLWWQTANAQRSQRSKVPGSLRMWSIHREKKKKLERQPIDWQWMQFKQEDFYKTHSLDVQNGTDTHRRTARS